VVEIVDVLVGKGGEGLAEQEITLELADDLREFLMREGFDPEFGARPLRRAIQTYVDDALADAILAGELQPGQTATLSVADGAVRVTASGEARIQPEAQPMRAAEELSGSDTLWGRVPVMGCAPFLSRRTAPLGVYHIWHIPAQMNGCRA